MLLSRSYNYVSGQRCPCGSACFASVIAQKLRQLRSPSHRNSCRPLSRESFKVWLVCVDSSWISTEYPSVVVSGFIYDKQTTSTSKVAVGLPRQVSYGRGFGGSPAPTSNADPDSGLRAGSAARVLWVSMPRNCASLHHLNLLDNTLDCSAWPPLYEH